MRRLIAFGTPPTFLMECEERADQEIDAPRRARLRARERRASRSDLKPPALHLDPCSSASSQRRQCGAIAALTLATQDSQ